ncbi:hypothetical protein DV515_00007935 [Chloebia gouldiae]|uniref:Secreted protein n=1 Tax=Chloebia gouldiae TaxID=44316 RepID=A0A3L8SH87_CHLGU|nr:hypothetical protein DV515_00007935 [Chloebia gouldiae]
MQEQRFSFIVSLHIWLWSLAVALHVDLVTQQCQKLKQQQQLTFGARAICHEESFACGGHSSNRRASVPRKGQDRLWTQTYTFYRMCTRRLRLLLLRCRGVSEQMAEALVILTGKSISSVFISSWMELRI